MQVSDLHTQISHDFVKSVVANRKEPRPPPFKLLLTHLSFSLDSKQVLSLSKLEVTLLPTAAVPVSPINIQYAAYGHSTVGCYDPRTVLDAVLKEKVSWPSNPRDQ